MVLFFLFKYGARPPLVMERWLNMNDWGYFQGFYITNSRVTGTVCTFMGK